MSDGNPEIDARFTGVENSAPATDEQKSDVTVIRYHILAAAHAIDQHSANPRYKATALTNLETAAMFAVKGVFQ